MSGRVTGQEELDFFKGATRRKVGGLRCPAHGQAPVVRFSGSSLRDVAIRMSGCCGRLMRLANAAIAARPDTGFPPDRPR